MPDLEAEVKPDLPKMVAQRLWVGRIGGVVDRRREAAEDRDGPGDGQRWQLRGELAAV